MQESAPQLQKRKGEPNLVQSREEARQQQKKEGKKERERGGSEGKQGEVRPEELPK